MKKFIIFPILACFFLGLSSFGSVTMDERDCDAEAARAWRVAITLTNGDYDVATDYHFAAFSSCIEAGGTSSNTSNP